MCWQRRRGHQVGAKEIQISVFEMWNLKNSRLLKIQCFWNAEPWPSVPSPCPVIGEWQLKELLIPVWFKCWPWKEHIAVPNLSWAGIRMCSVECNPGDRLMACSPWVRNMKMQTVPLGFLAATLGLRSVPHKLHPLLSFMDQTWLLQMCMSPEIRVRSLLIRNIADFLLCSPTSPIFCFCFTV